MKELEAKNLVDATFTAAYSEDKFRLFIRNLLPENDRCNDKPPVKEKFRNGIVSYKRLAKYYDSEDMRIDILAVKLRSSKTLENARTLQRNFIAWYLNDGWNNGQLKDAALVAFYTDDSDEWRFSLVRMDYVLDEKKTRSKRNSPRHADFHFWWAVVKKPIRHAGSFSLF